MPLSVAHYSVCNLYSGSLFLVPCVLLHLHGHRLLSFQAASVCGTSLVYHRQCIGTRFRCNPLLRGFDIVNSAAACATVLWYSWHDALAFVLMTGVPFFWCLEHLLMARGHFAGSLWGVAGLHSLCHFSAILSCCKVAGPSWEEDLYPTALAVVAALTASSLAEPQRRCKPSTTADRILAWRGSEPTPLKECHQ